MAMFCSARLLVVVVVDDDTEFVCALTLPVTGASIALQSTNSCPGARISLPRDLPLVDPTGWQNTVSANNLDIQNRFHQAVDP